MVLGVCGGAYYEHTQIQADEQQISDQTATITSLQAQVQTLKDAQAKAAASTPQQPAPANPASAGTASSSAPGATPAAPGAPAAVPGAPAAPAATPLTKDQMIRAVVVIKGDNAEGTGFLVKTATGPAVITNLHVIANNPNLTITTNTGAVITPLSLKGATDRDLAMFAIQDAGYSYLPMATDLSTVQVGDEVLTPGNSQGGGVLLSTSGKVVAIGPDRVEFDNPIYHGNSGGPVFHTKSGTVLAVVAMATKVDTGNDLDKTSFASRNSAITGSVRYFGLRLDTVPKWEPYDQRLYANQMAFLDQFDTTSRCLDSYMNSGSANDDDARLYQSNHKIVTANSNFFANADSGASASQRIDAARQWVFDIGAIADEDMASIQELNNFYSFVQQRARDETAYRKALKAEIDEVGNDVNRLDSLPRKSN